MSLKNSSQIPEAGKLQACKLPGRLSSLAGRLLSGWAAWLAGLADRLTGCVQAARCSLCAIWWHLVVSDAMWSYPRISGLRPPSPAFAGLKSPSSVSYKNSTRILVASKQQAWNLPGWLSVGAGWLGRLGDWLG